MTRDNVLFIVIGVLIGFIGGYLLHDVMAARQPPRLVHGQAGMAGSPTAPGGQAPGQQGNQDAQLQAKLQEMQQLEARLATNPDDTDAVLRVANLAFDTRNWSRCVEAYNHYLELKPADPDVLSDLGVCYREIGQQQKALELFERAQKLDPKHWQSRFNEVVVLAFDLRDFAAAERVLDELRALQPNNPDVERLAAEVARRRDAA